MTSTLKDSRTGPARICMPTWRGFNQRAYQCALYEAQDVLCEVDHVDLIEMEPAPGFRFKESWQRRLVHRDASRWLVSWNPGLRTVTLQQDYDLFVVVCQNHWDLLYVNAIKGWRDRCKTTVCWLDEMWAADIPLCKNWLRALEQFDHVFLGYSGTVAPLSAALGKPCRWLPTAVDTLRFSPMPHPPARGIDVYSVGRRWEGIHHALREAATRQELFYVYDTFPAIANMVPYDWRHHRDQFGNLAKRSRYFLVAPGKMNLPQETQGQVEIGYRYFEGAAAGAVMVGQVPEIDAFRSSFNWADAVVPMRPDGTDALSVLRELDAEAERADAIRNRNAVNALQRHDWVYRWRALLQAVNVKPLPAMDQREERLRALAALVQRKEPKGRPSGLPLALSGNGRV